MTLFGGGDWGGAGIRTADGQADQAGRHLQGYLAHKKMPTPLGPP